MTLPMHFFSVLQNGMPFLKYHLPVLKNLACGWTWGLSEGIVKIPDWFNKPGQITPEMHKAGLSVDGGHEWLLANIQGRYGPVYFEPNVYLTQRCQRLLESICIEAVVMQLDVDEFWTLEQLAKIHYLFKSHPDKFSMRFFCRYFVGPRLSLKIQPGAGNQSWDWWRAWRWLPGFKYVEHDPPHIQGPEGRDLNDWCFTREETRDAGLVFNHYSFCLPEQVDFKFKRYGGQELITRWAAMQKVKPPFDVFDYLPMLGHGEVECAPEEFWLENILK